MRSLFIGTMPQNGLLVGLTTRDPPCSMEPGITERNALSPLTQPIPVGNVVMAMPRASQDMLCRTKRCATQQAIVRAVLLLVSHDKSQASRNVSSLAHKSYVCEDHTLLR